MYRYISKVNLATVVEGDPKAPFSSAVGEGGTSFSWLLQFTLDLIMQSVKQGSI